MSPRKFGKSHIPFQIILSLVKDDYPWLYDAGMDVMSMLRSSWADSAKEKAISEFMDLVEFSFDHPMMREMLMIDKEQQMMLRELPYMLRHSSAVNIMLTKPTTKAPTGPDLRTACSARVGGVMW